MPGRGSALYIKSENCGEYAVGGAECAGTMRAEALKNIYIYIGQNCGEHAVGGAECAGKSAREGAIKHIYIGQNLRGICCRWRGCAGTVRAKAREK